MEKNFEEKLKAIVEAHKDENGNISYNEILRVLKIDPIRPRYNPKSYQKLLSDLAKIQAIVGNKEKADEIIVLCQIGEFEILELLYYA